MLEILLTTPRWCCRESRRGGEPWFGDKLYSDARSVWWSDACVLLEVTQHPSSSTAAPLADSEGVSGQDVSSDCEHANCTATDACTAQDSALTSQHQDSSQHTSEPAEGFAAGPQTPDCEPSVTQQLRRKYIVRGLDKFQPSNTLTTLMAKINRRASEYGIGQGRVSVRALFFGQMLITPVISNTGVTMRTVLTVRQLPNLYKLVADSPVPGLEIDGDAKALAGELQKRNAIAPAQICLQQE